MPRNTFLGVASKEWLDLVPVLPGPIISAHALRRRRRRRRRRRGIWPAVTAGREKARKNKRGGRVLKCRRGERRTGGHKTCRGIFHRDFF